MTPKQKKVSLNAQVLRSMYACSALLGNAANTLCDNYPHPRGMNGLTPEKEEQLRDLKNYLRVISDKLKELAPELREVAGFHPKSKWERHMDKLIAKEELEKSNAT